MCIDEVEWPVGVQTPCKRRRWSEEEGKVVVRRKRAGEPAR